MIDDKISLLEALYEDWDNCKYNRQHEKSVIYSFLKKRKDSTAVDILDSIINSDICYDWMKADSFSTDDESLRKYGDYCTFLNKLAGKEFRDKYVKLHVICMAYSDDRYSGNIFGSQEFITLLYGWINTEIRKRNVSKKIMTNISTVFKDIASGVITCEMAADDESFNDCLKKIETTLLKDAVSDYFTNYGVNRNEKKSISVKLDKIYIDDIQLRDQYIKKRGIRDNVLSPDFSEMTKEYAEDCKKLFEIYNANYNHANFVFPLIINKDQGIGVYIVYYDYLKKYLECRKCEKCEKCEKLKKCVKCGNDSLYMEKYSIEKLKGVIDRKEHNNCYICIEYVSKEDFYDDAEYEEYCRDLGERYKNDSIYKFDSMVCADYVGEFLTMFGNKIIEVFSKDRFEEAIFRYEMMLQELKNDNSYKLNNSKEKDVPEVFDQLFDIPVMVDEEPNDNSDMLGDISSDGKSVLESSRKMSIEERYAFIKAVEKQKNVKRP